MPFLKTQTQEVGANNVELDRDLLGPLLSDEALKGDSGEWPCLVWGDIGASRPASHGSQTDSLTEHHEILRALHLPSYLGPTLSGAVWRLPRDL